MASFSFGLGTTRQYPGSSGYWAGDPTYGQHGGYRPGYGYPGSVARVAGGFPQNEVERRMSEPNMAGVNPYGYGNNFGLNRGPGGTSGYLGQPGGNSASPGFQTLSNTKSPLFQNSIVNSLANLNSLGNQQGNPNTLYTNTKNPAIQSSINSMLSNPNAGANPRDFTKSGQFQGEINSAYSQADQDKQTNRDQFANFTNLFNSETPKVTANVNQENQSINDWYDPSGVQSKLDTIAAARGRAVNLAGQRALGVVGRNNALMRMANGDSSYATQQALDTSAGIYADEARQQADLARQNFLTTKEGQASLLGARNRGNDYLVNRQLQPVDALNALSNSENARIAHIGGMDLSNNIYTTPAEQSQQRAALLAQLTQLDNANNLYTLQNPNDVLAKRVSILGQLQQLNNSNNFYGLSTPYQGGPSLSGLPPMNISTPSTPQLRISGGNDLSTNLSAPQSNSLTNSAAQHSPADEIYKQQTGVYPQEDSNVSQVSLDRARNLASNGFIASGGYWYNPRTGQYIDPKTGQPLQNNMVANTGSFGGMQDYYNNLQMRNNINNIPSNLGYPAVPI